MAKIKKIKKKWIVLGIILIVLVIGFAIASSAIGANANGLLVEIAKATTETLSSEIQISGIVASEKTKTYYAPVAGMITELNVEEGAIVKTGDLLVAYDLQALEDSSKIASLTAEAEKYGINATSITLNKQASDYAKAVKDYDEAMAYVNHWTQCLEASNYEYQTAMGIKAEYETKREEVNALKIELADRNEPNEAITELITKGEAEMAALAEKMASYDYAGLAAGVETCQKELAEYKSLAEQYKAQKVENPALGSQQKQQQVLKEINSLQQEHSDDDLEKARQGVSADFTGIVTGLAAKNGMSIPQGMELFTIQSTDDIKVEVEVSKYDLEQLALGQKAEVTINGIVYEGTVSNISKMATISKAGGSVIKADVHLNQPDENIYLGIEAKVKILCDTVENALTVPLSCVNYDTKGSFCYVVKDGMIERREVVTGISSDHSIQIVSGIDEKDELVTEVTAEIVEGAAVTVKQDGKNEE